MLRLATNGTTNRIVRAESSLAWVVWASRLATEKSQLNTRLKAPNRLRQNSEKKDQHELQMHALTIITILPAADEARLES